MTSAGGKAVGEPPLLLGVSVWAAVKQALASVAQGRRPTLNLPATNEEILLRLTELKADRSFGGNGAAKPRAAQEGMLAPSVE